MKEPSNFMPAGLPDPVVVQPGEFVFAVSALEHNHIYGQTAGLLAAGGTLRWVHDPDPVKVAAFRQRFPQAQAAPSLETILDDPGVHLVAAAAVPSERGPLGLRVMAAGKDYFTDKCPFTTLDQLAAARAATVVTGRKYLVYYSERLHVECAVHAGRLIAGGAVGRVLQTIGLGPHRLGDPAGRPAWFFERENYGGILCDIGSHQCEQFLAFTGAADATLNHSAVANYAHPEFPELEDFGEISLTADNGASGYCRVDWFTPAGLRSWGDGRTFILGTKGSLELRKYVNVAVADPAGEQLYVVDEHGEHHVPCAGRVGFPFFGEMILDVLNRTETAMTQAHAFKAAELSLLAQARAKRLSPA